MTRLRIATVVLALIGASGCAAFRAAPRSGTPAGHPTVDTAPTPTPAELLDAAEVDLAAGNLTAAAVDLERLIALYPQRPEAAQALFQLTALYWNPASPEYDPAAALEILRRVVEEHPASPWSPAAAAVLQMSKDKAGLERAVAALQAQLEELKQLDLGPRG